MTYTYLWLYTMPHAYHQLYTMPHLTYFTRLEAEFEAIHLVWCDGGTFSGEEAEGGKGGLCQGGPHVGPKVC